jgi:hypothetical protein
VMTFWGFSAEQALPGVFLASPPRPPLATPIPQGVVASAPAAAMLGSRLRNTWWQWLLLAALLLLMLAALAWAVRPYLPHIEPQLEAEARDRALGMSVHHPQELQVARLDTLRRDNEALRLELARLTDQAAQRGGNCAAGVVGPGGVIGPGGVVGPGGAIVGVVTDKPIERGAGPDAKDGVDVNMANKADGKDKGAGNQSAGDKGPNGPDKGKQAADKKDEPKPMVVPPDAKQKQDLAFLKGDWRSRTGLATPQGEKNLHPSYTLDDKGKGKVSFVQQDGSSCEAPAEARWDSGKLVIEEKSNPKCSDGRTYARNVVKCDVGPDGVAQCNGSQPGDTHSYNVQIGR